MKNRAHNFGAGPCTLPLEVLEEAQANFVNFKGSGMSLIEMSHRGKIYDEVHMETLKDLRELYACPDDFEVLLIQGGATLQFSMIPMNILKKGKKAGYCVTGTWSKKSFADAKLYGDVYAAYDGKENNFTSMPETSELKIEDNTQYLYLCSNETIGGIRYIEWPEVNVPIVADMSSDFMSRQIPWEKFDLVYGGVQKNLGPAGVVVVFIRKHLLENLNSDMGAYLSYKSHADNLSLYNTPPVFSIYMVGLVCKWLKAQGGLDVISKRAEEKASLIYNLIDSSENYYRNPVKAENRSLMNIVFRLPSEELEKQFITEATAAGFIGLKGHRSVGGCRASVYNALPINSVKAFVEFMNEFKTKNPVKVTTAV